MNMAEKVERSRAHAQVALDAYHSTGNHDEDERLAITDLIADLLHLGQHLCADEGGWDPQLTVGRALGHYEHEADPRNAEEEA